MTPSNVRRTVVVAAASRHGSTAEIADRVATTSAHRCPDTGASAAANRATPGRSPMPMPWCWEAGSTSAGG